MADNNTARKINPDIEPDIRPDLHVIKGGGQTTPDRANLKDLSDKESNPDGPTDDKSVEDQENEGGKASSSWKDKTTPERSYTDANGKKHSVQAKGKFAFLKKKGPLALILTAVAGGGGMMSMLFSPGLLIIQLKEVMVDKFNSQLTSMDIRTKKVLKSKTFSSTGVCGTVISINCKFHSMSDRQIKRLTKAGFTIEPDTTTSILGRKKVKSITYDGVKYSDAGKFSKQISTDVNLRSSLKKAYNPLFAGFADKVWNKTLFKIKLTEDGIKITGANDDEKSKSLRDDINKKPTSDVDEVKLPDESDTSKYPDGVDDPNYKADMEDYNSKKALQESLDDITKQADDVASEVAEGGSKAAAKAAAAAVKVTGFIDNACMAYTTIRAVGFAAKVVRAAQLAKFAFMFLKIADQIKADGSPEPEDVAYLGKILTTDIVRTVGTQKVLKSLSATDSFGYRYAAYGDKKGGMSDSAVMFLAGGGLTGTLINVTSAINNVLGGSPDSVCKVNNNIGVQLGVAAGSLVLAFFTGGISISTGAVISGLSNAAIGLALAMLPALLQDIIAGTLIDKNTVGELAGDAITSGASGVQGTSASFTNAPLTVPQAEAYQELSNKIAVEYAEEERLAYSPFDISNKNTFLGSIRFAILPYLTDTSSVFSSIQSIASMATNSFSIANKVSAASKDSYDFDSYCTDSDYNHLNIATDPYCNIAYGIPTDVIDTDIDTVLAKMVGQVDDDGITISGSNYEKFQKDCINRVNPIGYTGQNFEEPNGEECIIGSAENLKPEFADYKYYYLYLIDSRVEAGMDGSDNDLNKAMEYNLQPDIGFYSPSSIDDNVAFETDMSEIFNSINTDTEELSDEIVSLPSTQKNNDIKQCDINYNFQINDSFNVLCGYAFPAITKKGNSSI